NLPHSASRVREAKSRTHLGVGVHLNLTLGNPVSDCSEIPSLLTEEGRFRKVGLQLASLPRTAEVRFEYHAQIEKFKKLFVGSQLKFLISIRKALRQLRTF
ncbi:MAG: hypothetical protein RIR97_1626, partial [Pseudomonadota bacterium]